MARVGLKIQKLAVNAQRRGEIRFETAYSAHEGARIAAKMARKGWDVEVKDWTTDHLKMRCRPVKSKRERVVASCTINPVFKRQLKRR